MKSKLILSTVGLGLFVGSIVGCSDRGDSAINNLNTNEATISLLIDNQVNQEGIRAVVADIEKKYHIRTEIETRPTGVEGHEMVKTRLATGDMTDLVFYNSGSLFQSLNPEIHFVELTDEPFMKKILPSFKESVSVNGKVYGVPGGYSLAGGWLYNKRVYRELGLDVPKTWNELISNSEKIKASGKTAVIGTYKDDWTSQLIVLADYHNVVFEYPSYATDFMANKIKVSTTPAALRSFEKLSEMYQRGYLNKDFQSINYLEGIKMLVEGTGVQYPMVSGILNDIEKNYPDEVKDIGFFPQPGETPQSNGLTVFMPPAIYISKNTQNIKAAKQWLDYFLSPEGIKTYYSSKTQIGPSLINGIDQTENKIPAVEEMIPYFNSEKTTPALEHLIPIKGPNLPQITKQIGSGQLTARQGAELYDLDIEKLAKQLGMEGW